MSIQEMIARQQAIVDQARNEGRGLTREEQTEFDQLQGQIDAARNAGGEDGSQGAGDGGQGTGEGANGGTRGMGNPSGSTPPAAGGEGDDSARQAVLAERQRNNDILALCRQVGMDPAEHIRDGHTMDQVRQAAVDFILDTGVEALQTREQALTQRFLDGLREVKGIRLAGSWELENRVGVISVDFENVDNAEASYQLEQDYGILTRCGLHCAPSAHKTLGTFPQGTVRFSLGHYNTEEEIDTAVKAIAEIAQG